MAVHASHAALPYPIKNARFSVDVIYLDNDGDPTNPVTPDTEISKDNGNFVDCAEEVAVPGTNRGGGMITFSGAEMDCSVAKVWFGVASGPKATMMTLQPRVLPIAFSGTATAGAAGSITLATSVPAIADLLIGCIVRTTGGTGGGGAGGANNQARVITAYSSGRVATVVPNWETSPDGTTTYEVLLTESAALRLVDVRRWAAADLAAPDTAGYPKVTVKDGTGAGEIDTTAGKVALADGSVTSATFAAGAIDANAIATDAIGAAEIAAGAASEIQSGMATAAAVAAVQADVDDIQSRLPAALVTGRMDASVGAMAANVVTAAAIADGAIDAATFAAGAIDAAAIAPNAIGASELAADAVTEIQAGLATASALATVQADTDALQADTSTIIAGLVAINADTDNIQTRLPTALVGGRMDASVGAMAADVLTASAIAADAIGASEIAAGAIAEIQSGLATSASVAAVQSDTDALQADAATIIAGLAAINADTDNLQARLPVALVGGKMDSVVSGGGGGGAWSLSTSARVRVERPSSGTGAENIHVYVENSSGAPIAADSLPTATATAIGGVDQTANLGIVTSPQTGHYVVPYNVSSTHPQPQGLYVEFTVIVGGVTKRTGVTFDVVSHNATLGSLSTLLTGVNVTRVQGTSLTAKTGTNFKFFFDNNDTITTKIVQDTGGTASIEVTLGAIMAVTVAGNRVAAPLILEMFQTEEKTFSFTVLDANGAPVSYAEKTLRFTAWDSNDPPNAVFEVEGADITITGAGSNVINVKVQPSKSALANEELKFSLWDVSSAGHEPVITWGQLKILPAVKDVA